MFSRKIHTRTSGYRELFGCVFGGCVCDQNIYCIYHTCGISHRNVSIDDGESYYSYQSNTRIMYTQISSLHQRNNSRVSSSCVCWVDFDLETSGYNPYNKTRLLKINKFVAINFHIFTQHSKHSNKLQRYQKNNNNTFQTLNLQI